MTSALVAATSSSFPRRRESSPELIAAYRATRYRIELPARRHIDLVVGRHSRAVERLLARYGAREGAFLTAFNPRSVRLADAANARAQRSLERDLTRRGCAFRRGAGIGADRKWPAELSVFVIGLTRDAARRLARKYHQRAFVYVRTGERVELVVL